MSICLSRLFAQGHLSISPQLTRSIDASWQKYQEIFEIFEEHMQEKYEKYFENIENIFKKYLDNFENIFRKYFRKQLPVTTFCFPQLFPANPLSPWKYANFSQKISQQGLPPNLFLRYNNREIFTTSFLQHKVKSSVR